MWLQIAPETVLALFFPCYKLRHKAAIKGYNPEHLLTAEYVW